MYSFQDKIVFLWYQFRYFIRKAKRKICRRLHLKDRIIASSYGYEFADLDTVQNEIINRINSGKPFMVGRLGGIESLNASEAIQVRMGLKKRMSKKVLAKAQINAGFFPPEEESVRKFSELIEDSLKQVDILGSMPTNNEEFLIRKNLSKSAIVTSIGCLEPYYSSNPWSKALEGKKILVIYPFKASIENQYKKRKYLFENANVLPEFELHVIKAVQSIAGTETEFKDWFSALEYMFNEAMKIDFDIAIIGCGAYGFPLAARIKKAGKQAIHLGGATQILFGVWGSRWDSVEPILKLKNEHWVRPSKEETPIGAHKVENACYW